jgi:hypothetical protein
MRSRESSTEDAWRPEVAGAGFSSQGHARAHAARRCTLLAAAADTTSPSPWGPLPVETRRPARIPRRAVLAHEVIGIRNDTPIYGWGP